jgi:hypothetical protein
MDLGQMRVLPGDQMLLGVGDCFLSLACTGQFDIFLQAQLELKGTLVDMSLSIKPGRDE